MAGIVFADANERKRLEMLTHPWIEKRRKAYFASVGLEARALVIDAPLLFEAGVDSVCDAVIFMDANPTTRLARVMQTRNWDTSMLERREDSFRRECGAGGFIRALGIPQREHAPRHFAWGCLRRGRKLWGGVCVFVRARADVRASRHPTL